MLQIWIPPAEVKAPSKVKPYDLFKISWKIWYLTDLQKFNLVVKLKNEDEQLINETEEITVSPNKWGYIKYNTFLNISDEKTVKYLLEAGHIE